MKYLLLSLYFCLFLFLGCKSSGKNLDLYPNDVSAFASYDLDTWQDKEKRKLKANEKKRLYQNTTSGIIVSYPFDVPIDIIKEASLMGKIAILVCNKQAEEAAKKNLTDAQISQIRVAFFVNPNKIDNLNDIPIYTISDSLSKYQLITRLPDNLEKKVYNNVLSFLNAPNLLKKVRTKSVINANSILFSYQNTAFIDIKAFTINKSLGALNILKNDLIKNLGIKELTYIGGMPENSELSSFVKILEHDKILIKEPITKNANYLRMEIIAKSFGKVGIFSGHKIQVVRLKEALSNGKETTYTNAIILANKIFVPQYGINEDAYALNQWKELMPNHRIIGCKMPTETDKSSNNHTSWDKKIKIH